MHVGWYWEQVSGWNKDTMDQDSHTCQKWSLFLLVQLTSQREDSLGFWGSFIWCDVKSCWLSICIHSGTCTHTTNAMHTCFCSCDSPFVFASTKEDPNQTLGSSESNTWGEHIVVLRCCCPPVVWMYISLCMSAVGCCHDLLFDQHALMHFVFGVITAS